MAEFYLFNGIFGLDNGVHLNASLRRELNAIKKAEYPWMLEVGKCAPQQAIKNLGTAFNRFFKKQGGYPKFKKKGEHDSFRCDNGPAKKG